MFKEFSLTAFLCIKKILSRFYGTTKRNAQHHEGSLWRSWGMNSDLHVSVQYLDYVIISTAHLKFIWWSWTSVSNCIFHLFLSTLLIAWGTGGEWSFYTLGVFFNTVLLSPLFLPPFLGPRLCEIKSLVPSTSEMQFSVFMHILAIKSLISALSFNAVTRFYYFFLGPSHFPSSTTFNSRQPVFSAFGI